MAPTIFIHWRNRCELGKYIDMDGRRSIFWRSNLFAFQIKVIEKIQIEVFG